MPYQFDIPLKPAANIEAPTATAALTGIKQEVAPKLAQLVIGEQLKGEILSRLQDGSYTVRVAGVTARMQLPEGSKVGDAVSLRLVSTDPRPTFLLDNSSKSGTLPPPVFRPYLQQEALDNVPTGRTPDNRPAGQHEAPTTAGDPGKIQQGRADTVSSATLAALTAIPDKSPDNASGIAGQDSAPTVLSDAGKLINRILQTELRQDSATSPVGKAAILTSAEEIRNPANVAKALQTTLASSGLFYESHVAEWANGMRALTDLLAEPQARTAPMLESTSDTAPTALANKEVAQLIRQQLDTLEQQRIVWQGPLLPGQMMEWEIVKERPSHDTDGEQEQSWQSIVRFDLPQLGQVSAALDLRGKQLRMRLLADQVETVLALQTHAAALVAALEAAGSPLSALSVNQHDER